MKVRNFGHKWRIWNQREIEREKQKDREIEVEKQRLRNVLQLVYKTRFARISRIEVGNSFESVNFVGRNPTSLIVSTFVFQPAYQIL